MVFNPPKTLEKDKPSEIVLSHAIVDNKDRKLGLCLQENITPESHLSIVSAYFTIYAYEALRKQLESAKEVRFLYGEPTSVKSPDPFDNEPTYFWLTQDEGIKLGNALAQKAIAGDCMNWIEDCVEIRTIRESNFLHGKMYHILRNDSSVALVGSSNFTKSGLGFGSRPNVELNLEVRVLEDRESLLAWFNKMWNDEVHTRDAKK